jgi:hypothetical protein
MVVPNDNGLDTGVFPGLDPGFVGMTGGLL